MIHWLVESALDLQEKPEWFLSRAEQEKFAAFRYAKRRGEWLLGRWTAKRLVQAVMLESDKRVIALDAIEIANDADGAPFAKLNADRLALNLSISHSFDHALCAASACAIGADLEYVEPRAQNLIDDFFTAKEITRVTAASPETHDLVVTAIWSAKEAALKALHKGLSMDTRVVEISIAPFERTPEQWTPFQITFVGSNVSAAPMRGWWRVFDHFVLTLASDWQDMPDAAGLLPETFLISHAPAPHAHASQRIGHPPHHPTHHANAAHENR